MIDSSPLDVAVWRKASRSSAEGSCVGVARPLAPVVGIRDTKAPRAGYISISPATFDAFLRSIKDLDRVM